MELLVLWIGTTITSFCLEIANELRVFKDVADAGYRIDLTRLSELGGQLNPNLKKATRLSLIVPVYNMVAVLQRAMQYNNIRHSVLPSLYAIDALEEMSEKEKQEYSKKPTALNALLVPLKTDMKLARSLSICVNDENNKIFFEFDELTGDIIILKATGQAARLTLEEQKEKVEFVWNYILTAGGYNTEDELENTDDLDSEPKAVKVEKMSDSEFERIMMMLANRSAEEQKKEEEKGPILKKKM